MMEHRTPTHIPTLAEIEGDTKFNAVEKALLAQG